MLNRLCFQRRILRLITSLVIGVEILMAEPPAAKPSPITNPANPTNRSIPNLEGINRATQLTDAVADSLEKRFRSPKKDHRDLPESENVLRRQVKKVVVDETKAWRSMVDGAVG